MRRIGRALRAIAAGFALAAAPLSATHALAGTVTVAVAANFTAAANEIAAAFAEETGHEAVLSFGSTGQLYTQITQGAPFEVFLAADQERPARVLEEGLAVEGSDFTYAVGQIVLWSADAGLVSGPETLEAGEFDKIAIANPETAPYGLAALQAMDALGVAKTLEAKIVQGNSIAQTYQFVETGNAELGFVALSQIAGNEAGSRWVVPGDLYDPIRQDAVLLVKGEENPAARAFLEFLRAPAATEIIEAYGYGVEGDG